MTNKEEMRRLIETVKPLFGEDLSLTISGYTTDDEETHLISGTQSSAKNWDDAKQIAEELTVRLVKENAKQYPLLRESLWYTEGDDWFYNNNRYIMSEAAIDEQGNTIGVMIKAESDEVVDKEMEDQHTSPRGHWIET